jgi:hypothetical protein
VVVPPPPFTPASPVNDNEIVTPVQPTVVDPNASAATNDTSGTTAETNGKETD